MIEDTADNGGPFSRKGDSGSGILNERNELIALLFAGSDDRTLANPIGFVVDEIRTVTALPDLEVVTV